MVRGRNKAARTVKYRNAKRKKMKQREASGENTIEDIGKKNVDHGLVTSTWRLIVNASTTERRIPIRVGTLDFFFDSFADGLLGTSLG